MKPEPCPLLNPLAEAYAEAHTTPEAPLLQQLERWAHLNMAQPRMLAGAYQGQLLRILSLMLQPRVVVEVGACVGYATVCLAAGLTQQGVLHAIEVDPEREAPLRQTLHAAGIAERVRVHMADAADILSTLPTPIDLAYVDADKRNTRRYYDLLIPHMQPGGIVLIDNVLWSGKVLHPQALSDADTRCVVELNDYIQQDPRVENILLPIRDGLLLCRAT